MRCNVPSCVPGDGEDAVRHLRRYHKPNAFDPPAPPPPWIRTLGAKLTNLYSQIRRNLTKIYSSTYYWGIVKSVTMFALGVKLFHDMHSKLSADCESQRQKKMCEEWEKKHNMKIRND